MVIIPQEIQRAFDISFFLCYSKYRKKTYKMGVLRSIRYNIGGKEDELINGKKERMGRLVKGV